MEGRCELTNYKVSRRGLTGQNVTEQLVVNKVNDLRKKDSIHKSV